LEVDIPAGIDDGMRVRVAGQGDSPEEGSGRNGDLLIQVNVPFTFI
jgi:molecular chaperone DnaJ